MKFNYQARTKTGEMQTGVIEAPSREAAFNLLRRYDFHLTALEEISKPPIYAKRISFFRRISRKDVVLFSRQLSIMFQSRVSLVEALRTLTSQTKNIDLKETLLNIVEDVEGGTPFSEALKTHPKMFSPFYVAMIKSGEVSGNLADVLAYLADHMEREYYFASKIKGAMIYPSLIVVVALFILAMMTFFVIPNLTRMLEETKQELPFITRVMMGFSFFMRNWGWFLGVLSVGAIFGFSRYYKSSGGKKKLDRFVLRLPLLGEFLKTVYLAQFAGNLSVLISGGLPIARGLEITAEIITNTAYRAIILQSREGVRKGVAISSVLEKYPDVFPPMFCQMVLVGEKTGTLDKTLLNVVSFYQKDVDRNLNNLLSILEPALIVVLGLMVAGLLAAVLLPLYKAMSI